MGNNEDRVVKYFFNNDFDKFKEFCLSVGFKDVYSAKNILNDLKETLEIK